MAIPARGAASGVPSYANVGVAAPATATPAAPGGFSSGGFSAADAVGAVSAVGGLLSSIGGAIGTYKANKRARKYSKRQAAQAEKAGRMNAAVHAINRRKLIGSQRAAFGASGVVANSGSPLDLMIDNYILGLVDESRALSDASYRAYDIRFATENAIERNTIGATRNLIGGLKAAGQQGLFSIKQNPVIQATQTLLGKT